MYDSEVQSIYQGIVNNIGCLYQMSLAIRQSAEYDLLMGITKEDVAPSVPYDRQHVENKFPGADSEVTKRLGVAILGRRAILKCRERQHAKLSEGLNTPLDTQTGTGSTTLSDTVATEFDETASDSGNTQTSYAQSLLESNDKTLMPSPLKKFAGGETIQMFILLLCYYGPK